MKIIKGDLILAEDTTFEESIKVEGNIICKSLRKSLKVAGNIDAWDIEAGNINARDIDALNIDALNIDAGDIDAGDINAGNIDAGDIHALNIDAWDIHALNIDAGDIDAGDIICETRKKKSKTAKTKCRIYIKNRSSYKYGEKDD